MQNKPTIALLGNPNSGKTTLFNRVTGRRQPVGNWSGVTIKAFSGSNEDKDIIDLPGTYSLTTIGGDTLHDENVPAAFLKTASYTTVWNVVDATALARHLYVTIQAIEQRLPLRLVVNRLPELTRSGHILSLDKLAAELGIPVSDMSAQNDLLQTPTPIAGSKQLTYPPAIETALTQLAQEAQVDAQTQRWQLLRWLEGETPQAPHLCGPILKVQADIKTALGESPDVIIAKTRYDFIDACLSHAMSHTAPNTVVEPPKPLSEKLDALFCHRFLGLPLFLGVMYALFFFAIGVGGYFQQLFEAASEWLFVDCLNQALLNLSAPTWVHVILVQGIGQAFSTLFTFVPVIGAMFFALAFLEECGYMARAAFVMDKLMRAVGLPGKSFVPMIVGFGCNVPAILGTRTLDNRRDRILAVMMSPFMSCGARLAIFTVFVAAFFPEGGQNIVFLLYIIGIAMAVLTGLLLKKTILRGNNAPFFLEIPSFKWPQPMGLLRQAWHRLKRFLINAGKLIVPVCMIIALSNQITFDGKWLTENNTQQSALSEIGQYMIPVFEPMGLDEENWPAAVGLLTGLMAKEVVIGTLNALYATTSDSAEQTAGYGEMVARFHGKANAFAYLLFVLLYFPCMSATAAMLREVQKGWTLFSICWTTGLAYSIAVGFYQCATFMAHPKQSIIWLSIFGGGALLLWHGIRYYSRTFLWHKVPTRVVIT